MADNQTRYAKLVNGTPRYAGYAIPTATGFIVRPTEAQLRANGWFPVVDDPPTTDVTHYARATGWAVQDGAILRQYEVVEIPPPPPRTWTPLSIKRACGVRWDVLKTALQANNIYDDFMMAQDVREGDEAFERGRAWAIAQFGEEVVEAVLAAAAEGN